MNQTITITVGPKALAKIEDITNRLETDLSGLFAVAIAGLEMEIDRSPDAEMQIKNTLAVRRVNQSARKP